MLYFRTLKNKTIVFIAVSGKSRSTCSIRCCRNVANVKICFFPHILSSDVCSMSVTLKLNFSRLHCIYILLCTIHRPRKTLFVFHRLIDFVCLICVSVEMNMHENERTFYILELYLYSRKSLHYYNDYRLCV